MRHYDCVLARTEVLMENMLMQYLNHTENTIKHKIYLARWIIIRNEKLGSYNFREFVDVYVKIVTLNVLITYSSFYNIDSITYACLSVP